MAEIKIDNNHRSVSAGITDDANQTIQPLRVDPSTNRLLVDSNATVTLSDISDGTVKVRNDSSSGGSLAVNLVSGTINVGTVAISDGTISSGTVNVVNSTDSGGSLAVNMVSGTIDSVTVSGGTLRSAGTAYVSGGTISINDGGNAITVDGTLTTVTTLTKVNDPVDIEVGTSVASGSATVATAATAVQLGSSGTCKRVWIGSYESNGDLTNGGLICVGNSAVVAAAGTRTGLVLYPTQGDWFNVSNTNLLYIDSVDDAASINYFVEI